MAIVYFPQNSQILVRNTISGSKIVEVLGILPHSIFYFDLTGSLVQSLYVESSSYAMTASWAYNSYTASYINFIPLFCISSSWASQSLSSSYCDGTSSYALSASWAPSVPSNISISSSWASQSLSSSYSDTSSWAVDAITAYNFDLYLPTNSNPMTLVTHVAGDGTICEAPIYVDSNGNLTASNIQATLIGTSSWASSSVSASYSLSSSYAPIEPVVSASISNEFGTKQDNLITGNIYNITSSWSISASWAPSVPSNIAISASWASQSLSASYAPIDLEYSSSVSNEFGTKQDSLVTGNTYNITSSWAISASWALSQPLSTINSASWASSSISASYLSSSSPSITTGYQVGNNYFNIYTSDFTMSNADDGKLVIVNNNSTTNVIITSSVSSTFNAMYYQSGSGAIQFITGASEILRNRSSHTKSAGQYALVSVLRVANGDFILGGDTA